MVKAFCPMVQPWGHGSSPPRRSLPRGARRKQISPQKGWKMGSRGLAPLGRLPLWGREGVTLTISTEGNPDDFSRVKTGVRRACSRMQPPPQERGGVTLIIPTVATRKSSPGQKSSRRAIHLMKKRSGFLPAICRAGRAPYRDFFISTTRLCPSDLPTFSVAWDPASIQIVWPAFRSNSLLLPSANVSLNFAGFMT